MTSVIEQVVHLLQMVVTSVLDHPQAVSFSVLKVQEAFTVTLQVPSDEIGKIIGDKGRTVRSLRTFFAALSAKHKTPITLLVTERPLA